MINNIHYVSNVPNPRMTVIPPIRTVLFFLVIICLLLLHVSSCSRSLLEHVDLHISVYGFSWASHIILKTSLQTRRPHCIMK